MERQLSTIMLGHVAGESWRSCWDMLPSMSTGGAVDPDQWNHDVSHLVSITNFDVDDEYMGKEFVRPDQTRHCSKV